MNQLDKFLGLIPKAATVVGEVTAVNGERHVLTLIGGGALVCRSQKAYATGDKVFVTGDVITGRAPDNPVVVLTV